MHRQRKKPGNEATEAAIGGYLYICSRVLQLVVKKKGEHF